MTVMTRTALVVANSTDADAGYVGDRFVEHGFRLRTVLRDRAETPASVPPGVHTVILLGSEWSVHAPVDPVARDVECRLARSAQSAGVPLLGLCYGAQIVAHAFGGHVSRSTQPEVGLVTILSSDEELVPAGPWSAFHVDVIDPPADAHVIAHNGFGAQAFTLPGVLAVQFHPEVRPDKLADWASRFPAVFAATGLDRDDMVQQARIRQPQARAAAAALVDSFLGATTDRARLG
jgi:GMP synthase-like glutamine amidotransferase